MTLISTMPPNNWRGALTGFACKLCTAPDFELSDATIQEIAATVAPADGPALVGDKDRVTYFVPGLLRNAPLVEKTLVRSIARGQPTIGKQRSAGHFVEACFMIFEFDGLEDEQWDLVLERLKTTGLHFVAYSTWSHGRADKPGVRVRVLVFLDRPLAAPEYARAWHSGNAVIFNGLADPTGAKPYQQQGVWATSPDRAALAFRVVGRGAITSSDALIAAAPEVARPFKVSGSAATNADLLLGVSLPTLARLRAAAPWINTDTYEQWMRAMMACAALKPYIGEHEATNLAEGISCNAPDGTQARNTDAQYDPAVIVEQQTPTMPPEAAAGTLFAMARDSAIATVKADRGKAQLSDRGRAAALYLATHHRAAFNDLKGGRIGNRS